MSPRLGNAWRIARAVWAPKDHRDSASADVVRAGATSSSGRLRGEAEPLRLTNLFNTLPELARLATTEIRRESWLDAYLLSAGIGQILDDYLQPDPYSLRRVAAFLASADAGAAPKVVARTLERSADTLDRRVGAHAVLGLQAAVSQGLDHLADRVANRDAALDGRAALDDLGRALGRIAEGPAVLPRHLRATTVRLPSCFRSFDQHPMDLHQLVRGVADAHPDRRQPIGVVGVRTSGSYLAPLCAAYLRLEGYAEVHALTMRPGRRASSRERALMRGIAGGNGLVLVCDDPPLTGNSMAAVAAALEGVGVPRGRIVMLMALFADSEAAPPALAAYESVLLPFSDWSIHLRLRPEVVRSTAQRLLGSRVEVVAAERIATRTPPLGRGHLAAVFALQLAGHGARDKSEMRVSVEGVGLGYFGQHAAAVAEPLAEFLPRVIGVDNGLLFRAWMPETSRADLSSARNRPEAAARVADYVLVRHRRLGLEADVTIGQGGQAPVWEVASTILSHSMGRAWPVGRSLVINRVAKRILRVPHPSVVDGRVDPSRWFLAGPGPGRMVKVDWDQGSSSNLGLACCDPVFDLATVTALSQDVALARELRHAYECLGGGRVDEDRWLLYELAYLTAGPNALRVGTPAVRRACGRAVQNYFRRVYFDDLHPSNDGPLCGIDIDGVLETEHLGFPALTPSSAAGLRALLTHGYRPLLVTGRSVVDVVDRCHAYRLAGGVAEYGLATYDAVAERITVLTSAREQEAMARLRTELRAIDGIELDEDYTHAIRAFVRDGRGDRGPVPRQVLARTTALSDMEPIRAIRGERQTDFVPDSVDKGRGTLALVSALGAEDEDRAGLAPMPLAFAVGDTTNDIPLLALAERPFVPAHSEPALGSRPVVTRLPHQRGFAEAVAGLIGHKPGACAHCRLPKPSRERRLLLDLLGMGEWGIKRRPWQLLKLRARA